MSRLRQASVYWIIGVAILLGGALVVPWPMQPVHAEDVRPVITSFVGPTAPAPDGTWGTSFNFSVSVARGAPPYTYRWYTDWAAGIGCRESAPASGGYCTLFEGAQYASVSVSRDQMRSTGAELWIWVSVTDSAGNEAAWLEPGGPANHEFAYVLTEVAGTATVAGPVPVIPYASAPLAGPPAPMPQDAGGNDIGARFSGIRGQVEVECPGGQLRLAKMDTVLRAGCRVIVDEDSSAVLAWADLSTYVVRGPAELVILDHRPEEPQRSALGMVLGAAWVNLKSGSMDIEMTQAVAGIKGTTLVLEQEPGGASTIRVIEGLVEVRSRATDGIVQLGESEQVSASEAGLGEIEPFDALVAEAEWAALRASILEQATDAGVEDSSSDAGGSNTLMLTAMGAGMAVLLGAAVLIGQRRRSR